MNGDGPREIISNPLFRDPSLSPAAATNASRLSRRNSTRTNAYPGTDIVAAPFFARSWEAQDNTYEPNEFTAPSIAETSDVDPPALAFAHFWLKSLDSHM